MPDTTVTDLEKFTPVADADAWLIVKRDLYYRPGGNGYTGIRDLAGRYSYEEAKAHECKVKGGNDISIVKLTDAPEFTNACYDDLARDHLKAKSDSLLAEVVRLRREMEEIFHIADDPEHSEHYNENMPRWRIRAIADRALDRSALTRTDKEGT